MAWPPGPINAEMIRRSLERGFWPAWSLGLGACSGDFLWAVAVSLGAGVLIEVHGVGPVLGFISIVLLLFLAWTFGKGAWRVWVATRVLASEMIIVPTPSRFQSARGGYLLGLTLALTSPWNIAFWTGVIGAQASGRHLGLTGSLTVAGRGGVRGGDMGVIRVYSGADGRAVRDASVACRHAGGYGGVDAVLRRAHDPTAGFPIMNIEERPVPLPAKTPFAWRARARSFVFAFQGVWSLLGLEHNAWLHLFAAATATGLGWWLGISREDWCLVIFAIGSVLAAEAFNTAIETLADALAPERHPLVGRAKDLAAAGVLLTSAGAAGVGLLVLGPPLLGWLEGR